MKKEELVAVILILVVTLVLVGMVIYTLSLRPTISGHLVDAQNDGYQYAISQIIDQVSTCQEVQLAYGDKIVNIISVDCLK